MRITRQDGTKIFSTGNHELASFLRYKGHKSQTRKGRIKVSLEFEDSEQLNKDILAFHDNELVRVLDYNYEVNQVWKQIRDAMRGSSGGE